MNPAEQPDSVAIVGMSCRFPGAPNLEAFWENLIHGVESIARFSDAELLAAGVEPRLLANPAYVKAGAVLEGIDLFDADFFGCTPREAEILDPQQRIFLECVWEALEDAGCPPDDRGGLVGVFAGAGPSSYLLEHLTGSLDAARPAEALQTWLGNDKDYLATRVSYKLNLRGPSLGVQTACSSSLVAVTMACQSLLTHQCDVAIAGGAKVSVPHRVGHLHEPGSILSPDGHCRAFDARAQGTVFGNGVGVAVLKRLGDALADGDRIYAVVRGSAVNNDGSLKAGFTAPSRDGQAAVVAAALAAADIHPETISYLEAHGTGTPIGDPIELAALTKAFRSATTKTGFCALGSVKSNFGHLAEAAGIAGLIKTALALWHKRLPPTLHLQQANPAIPFEQTPFYPQRALAEWPGNGCPRRAGVSSFGLGGTNAHVVLEEAATPPSSGKLEPAWFLLPLSAKTPAALRALALGYHDYLQRSEAHRLTAVCFTASARRRHFDYRRAFVAESASDLIHLLAQFVRSGPNGQRSPAVTALAEPVSPGSKSMTTAGAQRNGSARQQTFQNLATRYEQGAAINWSELYQEPRPRQVDVPKYPFQRQRYWAQPRVQGATATLKPHPRSCPGEAREPGRVAPLAARLKTALQGRIDDIAASKELARYRALAEHLDRLSPALISQALAELGCDLHPGQIVTVEKLVPALKARELQIRRLNRWMEILAEVGVLERRDTDWLVVRAPPPQDAAVQLRRLRDEFPDGTAELDLIGRCGEHLAEVVRGSFEPLELLFPAANFEAATRLYQDAPHARMMNSLVRDAVLGLLSHLPLEGQARLLEVGAGTGGTTSQLLPHLRGAGVEYTFTDIGRLFVDRAREKFRDWPFVRFATFNLEEAPLDQGFSARSYDLVIAANVLHATRDLRQTLRHLRQLLKPGGGLVVLEITTELRWAELTAGLIDGWWRFQDFDLRPACPLLSAASWEQLLLEAGFAGAVTLLPEDPASRRLFTQSVMVAEQAGEETLPARFEAPGVRSLAAASGVWEAARTAQIPSACDRVVELADWSSPLTEPAAVEAGSALAPSPNGPPAAGADAVLDSVREAAATVLGLPVLRLPVDRPLVELGLESLMAVDLRSRLSRSCAIELPMLKVCDGTTVNTLAETVRRCQSERPAQASTPSGPAAAGLPACILPIQGDGWRQPFFCAPPVSGSPMCYLRLAESLGCDRPFYGFQSPGLTDHAAPLRSLPAIAQCYVEAMRAVQPDGPYLLGGWSFGALVAWEMAGLLEARGEKVAWVGLFDAGITTAVLERRHWRWSSLVAGAWMILKHLGYLKLPTSYAEIRWLGQMVGISLPTTFREVWKRDLGSQCRFFGVLAKGLRGWARIVIHNLRTLKDYQPCAYSGGVTLFRAGPASRAGDTLIEGMERLAPGRLAVRPVPGNHMSFILDRPGVELLADQLKNCLDQFDRGEPRAQPAGARALNELTRGSTQPIGATT